MVVWGVKREWVGVSIYNAQLLCARRAHARWLHSMLNTCQLSLEIHISFIWILFSAFFMYMCSYHWILQLSFRLCWVILTLFLALIIIFLIIFEKVVSISHGLCFLPSLSKNSYLEKYYDFPFGDFIQSWTILLVVF